MVSGLRTAVVAMAVFAATLAAATTSAAAVDDGPTSDDGASTENGAPQGPSREPPRTVVETPVDDPLADSKMLVEVTTSEPSIAFVVVTPVHDGESGGRIAVGSGRSTHHQIEVDQLRCGMAYVVASTTIDREGHLTRHPATTRVTPACALLIQNPTIREVGATTAVVAWNTTEPTTGLITFGHTRAYDRSTASPGQSRRHHIRLTDLECGSTYHFSIIAQPIATDATAASRPENSGDRELETHPCDPAEIASIGVDVGDSSATVEVQTVASANIALDVVDGHGQLVSTDFRSATSRAVFDVAHPGCDVVVDFVVRVEPAGASGTDGRDTQHRSSFTTQSCDDGPGLRPIRVMAFGDSITAGLDGQITWRQLVHDELEHIAHGNASQGGVEGDRIDMVGSEWGVAWGTAAQNASIHDDRQHQSHPGFTTGRLAGRIAESVERHRPDLVLVHAGTNDVIAGIDSAEMAAHLKGIVSSIWAVDADTTVVMATLTGCANWRCGDLSVEFASANVAITDLVIRLAAEGRPIKLADMAGAYDLHTGTFDGLHPNSLGDLGIAERWMAALGDSSV